MGVHSKALELSLCTRPPGPEPLDGSLCWYDPEAGRFLPTRLELADDRRRLAEDRRRLADGKRNAEARTEAAEARAKAAEARALELEAQIERMRRG